MGKALRVLMLEDSEEDAGLVLRSLKGGGFDVEHVRVQSALDFKQALKRDEWDIILSDYAMPGFNGMEAFSILKNSGFDLPFVMISGTIGEEIAVEAMRHGVQDYLMKDNLTRLPVAVDRELRDAKILTEKNHLHSLLQANERRYQSIFNSASVSLWEVDFSEVKKWFQRNKIKTTESLRKKLNNSKSIPSTSFNESAKFAQVLDVNQTTLSLLNLDLDLSQENGQTTLGTIAQCWPAGFQQAWNDILEALLTGQQSLQTEGVATDADGKQLDFLISLVIPHSEDELKNVVISCYDTTQKNQMEKQIIVSQRMDAIGQLAGGVAHDFNNLLTVILSATHLLQVESDGHAPFSSSSSLSWEQELIQIQRAAERATQLTQQLLAFSRKQVLQFEIMKINEKIDGIVGILGKLLGEHINIVSSFSSNVGYINADSTQLEQIILNLAVNARDAMPEGGDLIFATGNVELSSPKSFNNGVIPIGHYVLLTVQDSGTGISKDVIPHIFEPFFTTKEQGKGTGLGLATVYGNVQQNNGYILVESELNQGACFSVYFPCVQMTLTPEQNKVSLPLIAGGIETVLIVEDEEMVRNIAHRILERQGYKTLQAENGVAALELAENYDGKIDLLLTDMVMPKMGGRKLEQKFAELYPATKVLFMTGYTPDNLEESHFIQKPFMNNALVVAVREMLDQ